MIIDYASDCADQQPLCNNHHFVITSQENGRTTSRSLFKNVTLTQFIAVSMVGFLQNKQQKMYYYNG